MTVIALILCALSLLSGLTAFANMSRARDNNETGWMVLHAVAVLLNVVAIACSLRLLFTALAQL
jgi:hypothetical protein